MERLKETEKFKIFKRSEEKNVQYDLDEIETFLRQFVLWQEHLYSEIAKRVNWILVNSKGSTNWQYFKLAGEEWRIGIYAADDFRIQKKVDDIWTEPPIAKWTE